MLSRMFKEKKRYYCADKVVVKFNHEDTKQADFSPHTFSKYAILVHKGVAAEGVTSIQTLINRVPHVHALMEKAMHCICIGGTMKNKTMAKFNVTHAFDVKVKTNCQMTISYTVDGITSIDEYVNKISLPTHECMFIIDKNFNIISQNKLATDMIGDFVNIYSDTCGLNFVYRVFDNKSCEVKLVKNAIMLANQLPPTRIPINVINAEYENENPILMTNVSSMQSDCTDSDQFRTMMTIMSYRLVYTIASVRVDPIDDRVSLVSIRKIGQTQIKYKRLAKSILNVVSSILPLHVVKYMADEKDMKNISSLTQTHNNVCILFTDIIDWTIICDDAEPRKIFDFLNELYNAYDEIADEYNVYKLETVGDCYVAVTGLMRKCGNGMVEICNEQEQDDGHVFNMIAFAKRILDKARHIKGPRGQSIGIRIGIHVGSVNSGVIGYTMPKFVLTGDAMNVASRLEQYCVPNSIQVSEEIIQAIKPDMLEFVPRGDIDVKGKGKMTTYLYSSNSE